MMTLSSEKQALRDLARARRQRLSRALPDFAKRIASFTDDLPDSENAQISGYRALAEEADPSLLLQGLEARGCEICYPRVHMKGHPLWFHVPVAQEPWLQGAFGIPEPRPDWPRAFPPLLLVPLLAFDSAGYRLGYGGGYYDRTLAQFRAERPVTAIGIAFAGQEIPSVPHDSSDEQLDMIVTEAGVRRFREQ
jgi:5-formyltetrahydrofolate cyclo-ligase